MYRSAALIGVFDLFHLGHRVLLHRASAVAESLLVLVVADEAVRLQKGEGRPVEPLAVRMAAVEGYLRTLEQPCEVRAVPSFDPTDAVLHSDVECWIAGGDQGHIPLERIREARIPILVMPRTRGVSTSEIIKQTGQK